jgi:hypothetical protein
VEAARETLAGTKAGTATAPADQELTPDLASGTHYEPEVL